MTTGDPMLSFSGGAAMAGETEETTKARMQANNTPSLNRKRLCFMSVLESASVTGRGARGNRAFDLGNSRRIGGPRHRPMGVRASAPGRACPTVRSVQVHPPLRPLTFLRFATHDLTRDFSGCPAFESEFNRPIHSRPVPDLALCVCSPNGI